MKNSLRTLALILGAPLALGAFNVPAAQEVELRPGDLAPAWDLESTDGKLYRLGERAAVLAWFPKAYTRGCTIECKSLAENGHLIRAFDVDYFMASVDPIEDNRGFAVANNADFPLLSDPTKETATAYGVLHERGFAMRHTFYIDADGTILAIDRNVNPATAAEDIAAKLAELNIAPAPAPIPLRGESRGGGAGAGGG